MRPHFQRMKTPTTTPLIPSTKTTGNRSDNVAKADDTRISMSIPTSSSKESLQKPSSRSLLPAWRLHLCTLSYAGVMVGYAAQANLGSSELLRLGVPKNHLSWAWLAGPLSGLFMQPIIGWLTDVLRMRRPFIFLGAATTALSLLYLSNAQSVIAGYIAFYALDLSLQIVQAPVRAIVTDGVPPRQRAPAAAGLAAAAAAGALTSSALAAYDWINGLKTMFPEQTPHKTHAQIVLFLSAILVMVFIMPCAVLAPKMPAHDPNSKEDESGSEAEKKTTQPDGDEESRLTGRQKQQASVNPIQDDDGGGSQSKNRRKLSWSFPFSCFSSFTHSLRAPRPFWHAFAVQLCTWSGFFANAVYANTWVGGYIFSGDGSAEQGSLARTRFDDGIRLGSLAAALGAVVTLILSAFLSQVTFPLRNVYITSQLFEMVSLCAPWFMQHVFHSTSHPAAVSVIAAFGVVQAVTNIVPWLIVANALQLTHRTRMSVGFFTTLFNVSQSLPQLVIGLVAPVILKFSNGDSTAVMFTTGIIALLGAVLVITLDVEKLESGERITMRKGKNKKSGTRDDTENED